MSEGKLLAAIYDDDAPMAKKLLKADKALATKAIMEDRLYEGKILHWIYAGDTPLHLAAAGHRVELVQLLLGAGADPNACANHRRSGPLHYAADGRPSLPSWDASRQVETIRRLLEAGADVNAQDKNGATPLHRAVRTRSAAAVNFLLDSKADASVKNKPGSTAFHLAVQNTGHGGSGSETAKLAQRQIIAAFLAHGVSFKAKDGKGKSVLDCVSNGGIREMLC